MPSKFRRLLRCFPCGFSFVLGFAGFFATFAYFFHYDLTVGNLGRTYANAEVFSAALNAGFFGAYLSMATYRFRHYKTPVRTKHSGFAAIGTALSALVAGCPACAPTLASSLGLFSFVALFPGGGLGLKTLGAVLLAYSVTKTYRELDVCGMGKR